MPSPPSNCVDCAAVINGRATRCKQCSAFERWRTRRQPSRFCKVCEGEIVGANRVRGVYCSIACKFACPDVRAKLGRPPNFVTKTCPHCGKHFNVNVSMAGRYNFCSRDCSVDARGRDGVCLRCGGAFRYGQTSRRSYCSEACRRPPIIITCAVCSKDFRVTPTSSAKRRFCSARCYRASGLETSIERTVRLVLERMNLEHLPQAGIGQWTVDFLVMPGLVIEADGSYWHSLRVEVDQRKTADLESRGYTVWRVPESEIRDIQFASLFEGRLMDYEHAHGQLARVPPFEASAIKHEHGMVGSKAERVFATQLEFDYGLVNL